MRGIEKREVSRKFMVLQTMNSLRRYWRVVISYARTSKEVISSMSKAQISGYCKRLWEVHHSLRTSILHHLLLFFYTIHIYSAHITCHHNAYNYLRSSYHSQEHKPHLQTEDSCNNPAALPHRARSCRRQHSRVSADES